MLKKILMLLGLLLSITAHAYADNPVDFIRTGSKQVLDILKQDNGKNTKHIRQQAETQAIPMFDFQRMTALAVGVSWRQATPGQRQRLTQEFQTLLIRTYSATMVQFKHAQVDVQPNTVPVNKDIIVKTTVTLPGNNNPVSIDYTLHKDNQGWKIYNVSVEGASLVTVYRNTFTQEVRKNSVEGLIKLLQQKNSTLTNAAPTNMTRAGK